MQYNRTNALRWFLLDVVQVVIIYPTSVLSLFLCWKRACFFLIKLGGVSWCLFTQKNLESGGGGGGSASVMPHWFSPGLLHEPLIFLALLSLLWMSLETASRIFLLNHNFDYVILQSINFHDSTLTIQLSRNVSNWHSEFSKMWLKVF